MFKTLLKSASLAAAGTIFAAGIAMADPNRYPYVPDTEPQAQSRSQPLTGAARGARSFDQFEDHVDSTPMRSSRYQRIAHEPVERYDMTDSVDLVLPRPMHR